MFKLFTETDCLTAQSNLDDICSWLRFFKDGGEEQHYLSKYLPKLAEPQYKEAFDEFIGRLENKEMAATLKAKVNVKKADPVVVEPVSEPVKVPVTAEQPITNPLAEKPKKVKKVKAL